MHTPNQAGVLAALCDGGEQGATFFGEVSHEGGSFGAFEEDFIAVAGGITADLEGEGFFAANADGLNDKVVELGVSEGSTPNGGESHDGIQDG